MSEAKKGKPSWNRGLKMPPQHGQKLTAHLTGRTGPLSRHWKGGTSKRYRELYNSPRHKAWRAAVFSRDGYACVKCGSKGYLTAHHTKSWTNFPLLRFEIDNGQTLCEDCHSKTDNYKHKAKKHKHL